MLRSRIAAAAVGATVLGVTAALVPTVSNADTTGTATATPVVTWKDSPSDFAPLDTTGDTIPAGWSWYGYGSTPDDADSSLSDYATFDANGVTAKQDHSVGLIYGLPTPIAPSALSGAIATSSANAGDGVEFVIYLASASDPTTIDGIAVAEGRLNGSATTWSHYSDSGAQDSLTSDELVAAVQEDSDVAIGYDVEFGSTPAIRQEKLAPEVPSDIDTSSATSTGTIRLAAAASPAAEGISSLAFGDTTTYFTPQPTATVSTTALSATRTAASTKGIAVTGAGFAPGEVVNAGVSGGQSGSEIPGVALVADADGNVSGTIVIPADLIATPGTYALVLVGASSGQTASVTLTITADPAAVATPVPARATFTG